MGRNCQNRSARLVWAATTTPELADVRLSVNRTLAIARLARTLDYPFRHPLPISHGPTHRLREFLNLSGKIGLPLPDQDVADILPSPLYFVPGLEHLRLSRFRPKCAPRQLTGYKFHAAPHMT